jgi:hypothetical protein
MSAAGLVRGKGHMVLPALGKGIEAEGVNPERLLNYSKWSISCKVTANDPSSLGYVVTIRAFAHFRGASEGLLLLF